jgi:hypothetical protein
MIEASAADFGEEIPMRLLITLYAATFTFGAAAAGDQPTRIPQEKPAAPAVAQFDALDRNGDQELSKIEARKDASISAQFSSMDVNLNGFITKAEYTAYMQVKSQPSEREPLDRR